MDHVKSVSWSVDLDRFYCILKRYIFNWNIDGKRNKGDDNSLLVMVEIVCSMMGRELLRTLHPTLINIIIHKETK